MARPVVPRVPGADSRTRRKDAQISTILNSLVRDGKIVRKGGTKGRDTWDLVAGVSDGDFGDIVISGDGTIFTLDPTVVTAFARTFLDDADAATVRATIGAGTSTFDGAYSSLSGIPSTFAPSTHATSHQSGGGDSIKLDDLAAPDDNTDLNVSTGAHGLAPKLPNDSSLFLNGVGGYSAPAGSGASEAYARRAPHYLPFTVTGDDDEFDDGSFSGWTAVDSGSHIPTIVESNDVLSLLHPGGDATAELHAYVKARTINANDYVEGWVSHVGRNQNFNLIGMIMGNGASYGAGTQVAFWASPAQNLFNLTSHTNYSTAGTSSTFSFLPGLGQGGGIGMRLVYLGSNNWAGYVSSDGIQWVNITGTISRTMTPTHAGFMVSTYNGAQPALFNVRYIRFGP